jgi:hypothetical protein
MKKKDEDRSLADSQNGRKGENDLPGYPSYPANEDIFNKFQEEKDINPEDTSKPKELNSAGVAIEEIDLNDEHPGNDLDVPGSELDDEMEDVGSEDEENNYYSIGGDGHADLDENKG